MTRGRELEILYPLSSMALELRRFSEGDGLFYVFLPYSDLREWIPENSVYEEAYRTFPMVRLEDVKSLSLLSYHGPRAEEQYSLPFTHSRGGHTSSVELVGSRIIERNGYPQDDKNTIILASALHDIATPAGGDATKKLDPANLDEEKFWWEALDDTSFRLLERYGITSEEIDAIISNKGILGQVLDIADRITYVMQDLYAIVGYRNSYSRNHPYNAELHRVLSRRPRIGNIYKDISIDKSTEEVCFKNPGRLKDFLMLRALLHQKLYMHPVSMGRDWLAANLIKPFYSSHATDDPIQLTPSKLRRMTDDDLITYLWDQYGRFARNPREFFHDLVNCNPKYEQFNSKEEAQEFAENLSQQDNIVIIKLTECQGFDPGTTYKVPDKHGRIVSLRDFDPGGAAKIEGIEQSTRGVFVFYADISDPSLPINNLIKTAREKGAFQQSFQN